jgi:uncharacterized protein YegL
MCKENSSRPLTDDDVRARCEPLGDETWVLGLTVGPDHPARCQSNKQSTRFHFVLDNSASMGHNSQLAKDCFANLVSLASGPCSLVAFDTSAHALGENFDNPAQMRATRLPSQGGTNITAGLQLTLDIIKRDETKQADDASFARNNRTHHVLVLLSDGAHNRGPKPEDELPVIGSDLRKHFPLLRLSVVVVGVTSNSNTSMGMLLKQCLETVALKNLEPIYFANTTSMMETVLQQMHDGLASLQNELVTVSAPAGCLFVRAVGEPGVSSVDLLAENGEQAVLCLSGEPPSCVEVDGVAVTCTTPPQPADVDIEFVNEALQQLLDGVRVRRVAVGAAGVRPALQQLRTWVAALEKLASERQCAANRGAGLCLARATPSQRLAQHKAFLRTTHTAKELLNQLAEIEACTANDSASQAAFLTGAKLKYGAKALRRASAHKNDSVVDPAARLLELKRNIASIAPKMKRALREDFCQKLFLLDEGTRQEVQKRLAASAAASNLSADALRQIGGDVAISADRLDQCTELAALVDNGVAAEVLLTVSGKGRQSYLSLNSTWHQLQEWCDSEAAISSCSTEYQLLMCLGVLGYPIEVQRRDATQMDPYAMDITRVRASLADTASLLTALHSDQEIVPPEGGVAVQDLLVLVDPDAPRASRLAIQSTLLKEAYTSVVLCRDLHMFTGNKMRLAIHAHSLLAVVQPAVGISSKQGTQRDADIEAQLRRQYLGRAFQCAKCNFGPIDHFACGDLEAHHGEHVGRGAKINNACPRCDWFSADLSEWPTWDGKVPKEALEQNTTGAFTVSSSEGSFMTAASVEMALRICYSARALWQTGPESEAQTLCEKLANWEPITTADGVDHPVQLLLALATVDNLPTDCLGFIPVLSLLNEVCARRARGELRQLVGTDEPAVMAAARKRVAGFLGVTVDSAPQTLGLEQSEPRWEAVAEACCGDFNINAASFDFKEWVRNALQPWLPAIVFVRRLRLALQARKGGWSQLAKDMEVGLEAYSDMIQLLQKPLNASKETLRLCLGVERASEAPRVLATIAGQAFLHSSSQLRRTSAMGGALQQPLGDVRDGHTLRALCVELRMAVYEERVAEKMREWSKCGQSLTFQRAMASDLEQYVHMLGSHAHGLDKQTFWGLWQAAKTSEKARLFLSRANRDFVFKHGR